MIRINWKSIFYWLIGVICYFCWFMAFYNSLKYDSIFPYENLAEAWSSLLNNFLAISVIFLLNWLTVFRLVKIKNIHYKVISDILVSFSWLVGLNWLYLTIHGMYREVTVDWAGTFLNDIIILLGIELIYYFQNYNKSRIEIETAARKSLQYKYDALKAQINPHFLFNSLNLLASLVSLDKEKSKKFILGLASMYRYILSCEGKETIRVSEELEFLESYVEVLEMRYNNKLLVKFEGSAFPEARIVPYTMQLLIENVTKHNVISSKYPMTVTIKITEEGITVSNPIRMRPTPVSGGIGLRYLRELYGLYNKNFTTTSAVGVFIAQVPFINPMPSETPVENPILEPSIY